MLKKTYRLLPYFLLTAILSTGIIFPACEDEGILPPCNCTPTYFDIEDISASLYDNSDPVSQIDPMDSIRFEDLGAIHLDYQLEYISETKPANHKSFSFSLLPSLYACSCAGGTLGSKEEELLKLEIISLNDFDEEHKANSKINDLLTYRDLFDGSEIPLNQFLATQSGLIQIPAMRLLLDKAPELDSELKLKIIMELSTGELYEIETDPIYLLK